VRATIIFGRRSPRCASSVAANDPTSPQLLLQVAQVAHVRDPRVRLDLVPVDDDRDLVQPPVRRRLQRLPELALLELPVAGEDVDAPAAAEQPVREHEAARLRDPHAERAGAGHDRRRRRDIRVPGEAVEPPQLVDELEVEPPERREHGVEAGDVVPLRREVAVAVAEHLQVQPADDVERAEGRAGMAGTGALDHVQRVQPAGIRERRRPLDRIAVESDDAPALLLGHEPEPRGRAHRPAPAPAKPAPPGSCVEPTPVMSSVEPGMGRTLPPGEPVCIVGADESRRAAAARRPPAERSRGA
jgi:hypothetical protein